MKESFAELKRLTFFLPQVFVIHGIQWFETLDYTWLFICLYTFQLHFLNSRIIS